MSFLKTIGTYVLKIVGIATGVLPLIAPALSPKVQNGVAVVEDKLNQSLVVIQTAEQMFAAAGVPKAGSQKLAAAAPFIGSLLQNTEALAGKKVKNEAALEAAIKAITGGLADAMNAYGD